MFQHVGRLVLVEFMDIRGMKNLSQIFGPLNISPSMIFSCNYNFYITTFNDRSNGGIPFGDNAVTNSTGQIGAVGYIISIGSTVGTVVMLWFAVTSRLEDLAV